MTPILNYSSSSLFANTSVFITRFDIDSRADLEAVDTTNLALETVFQFISGTGRERIGIVAELQPGPADPADTSQVAPNNYDETLNDKHWQVVSGYLT